MLSCQNVVCKQHVGRQAGICGRNKQLLPSDAAQCYQYVSLFATAGMVKATWWHLQGVEQEIIFMV
jgi:hypothetical protein